MSVSFVKKKKGIFIEYTDSQSRKFYSLSSVNNNQTFISQIQDYVIVEKGDHCVFSVQELSLEIILTPDGQPLPPKPEKKQEPIIQLPIDKAISKIERLERIITNLEAENTKMNAKIMEDHSLILDLKKSNQKLIEKINIVDKYGEKLLETKKTFDMMQTKINKLDEIQERSISLEKKIIAFSRSLETLESLKEIIQKIDRFNEVQSETIRELLEKK